MPDPMEFECEDDYYDALAEYYRPELKGMPELPAYDEWFSFYEQDEGCDDAG